MRSFSKGDVLLTHVPSIQRSGIRKPPALYRSYAYVKLPKEEIWITNQYHLSCISCGHTHYKILTMSICIIHIFAIARDITWQNLKWKIEHKIAISVRCMFMFTTNLHFLHIYANVFVHMKVISIFMYCFLTSGHYFGMICI